MITNLLLENYLHLKNHSTYQDFARLTKFFRSSIFTILIVNKDSAIIIWQIITYC